MLNHNRRPHNTNAADVVADIRGHVCTRALKDFRQKARHRAERKGACLGHALVCAANLACLNLRKKAKIPLRRESSRELRIVSGGDSDENTDDGLGRSRFSSGSGERQLAQRAANRSAADLQDVRRHLSSARGLAITNVSLPPW